MSTEWTMVPVIADELMQKAMQRAVLMRKSMNEVWQSALSEVAASPQPAAQPELCMCKDRLKFECPGEWEPGCDLGANEKFVRKSEQPEPGALTDEQCDEFLAFLNAGSYMSHPSVPYLGTEHGDSYKAWARRFAKAAITLARKRTAEQNARIMEAVRKLACLSSDFAEGDCTGSAVDDAFAEVERLLGGEA